MDCLTLLEIFVSISSFCQIIACFGAIVILWMHHELMISKRSWSLFAFAMIIILLRRSLSMWAMAGSGRILDLEYGVTVVLSFLYILMEASIIYDTLSFRREHG